MSNDQAKLKHHEKPIWRKVFEAKVGQGVSVEAAARHAWQAVKIWHAAGAFNEQQPDTECDENADYREAFKNLLEWIRTMPAGHLIDSDPMCGRLSDFDRGDLDPDEFANSLRSIYDANA